MAQSTTSVDLLAELRADSGQQPGCTVCKWLRGRDDASEWEAAFAAPDISTMSILRGMKRRGAPFGKDTTFYHRRGHK